MASSQRANLTSMHDHGGHEFSELVWKNGQALVQSLPRKTKQSSSSFVNVNLMKKTNGNRSLQDSNKHNESLYQNHFINMFLEHNEGITGCDKNLMDPQIVPVNEYANRQLGGGTGPSSNNYSREIHSQASTPVLKRPRVVSVGDQEKYLESDRKREKAVNFSLFLRSSPVVVKSNNNTSTAAGSSRSAYKDELMKNINVDHHELVPDDDQSEAVCRDGEFTAKAKLIVDADQKSMEPKPVASSSLCSRGASNNPVYNHNNLRRRYHEDIEWSADLSDQDVEEKLENIIARKQVPAARGGGAGTRRKQKRTSEVHNQSERKRRDKINKKMRALRELIPNCDKVDKVSMLDEAIEYLKTLQLQVQMLSMGSGVCMPHQMMMATGMQQMHNAPQMAHFSPMMGGVGMAMNMMRMQMGCSQPQFLISHIAAANALSGITQNRFQMPGFAAAQPLLSPMSLFRAPMGLLHKPVAVSRNAAAAPVEFTGSANNPNQKVDYFEAMNNAKNVSSNASTQPSI
ncbi:hypothetical protein Dsin_025734 [Dipteronia sinensis]|uniref:BHLH domain-containing protein n=1 Tax=Dipteronia sinensis TaxID=43782 RepID=A0AAD9ZWR1_9ROSI|nr:hypothetical protein Dsin_025734 [Dipteronia sinensis]